MASLLAVCIVVMGGAVMTGWYIQYSPLVQINATFAPMQFNTALCFFLSGLSILLISRNLLPSFSKLLATIVFLISGLTFMEYLTNLGFHIDNAFVEPFITTKTTHPGRMAPNTALCFIVLSLALVARESRYQKVIFFSAALSLMVFVMLSFTAYGMNSDNLYGMGTFSRMAIHTTFGFLFASISMLLLILTLKDQVKINKWDILPVISFTVLALLSIFSWNLTKEIENNKNKQNFIQLVQDSQNIIKERFALYQQSLLGGLGLFNASDNVTLDEWKKYVAALNIDENLPGINGIGYIDYVRDTALDSYLNYHIENTYDDYKNHPDTDFLDKFIIRYSEPLALNKPAIGLDIGFEANRREAAEKSRDSAKPVLTRKIILVQDNVKRAGFLLLIPRYNSYKSPTSIQGRQENIVGWVYAPFISDKFLAGIEKKGGNQIGFTIYDGHEEIKDNIIFNSQDHGLRDSSIYDHRTQFTAAERTWTIRWYTTPSFFTKQGNSLDTIVFITGFLITLLITGSLFLLARINGQAAQDLIDNRNQLDAIIQGAVDGLITFNDTGEIITFNKACETIFGYKSSEVIGKNANMLMPPKYTVVFEEYLKNPDEMVFRNSSGTTHQITAIRKNGTIFPIDLSIGRIPLNDDLIFSGIIRDITDRRAAEMEIIRSNEELENFAYIASHDLQEPIRMVSNFTSLLQNEYKDNLEGDGQKYLEFIMDGSARMKTLISDLLDYSRVNSDEAGFDDFNPQDQLDIVLRNLREQIDQTQAKITVKNLPDNLNANPIRFSRLLQNLIGNAIKYRKEAPKPLKIDIAAEERPDDWLFSIKDNGIGMKQEYLEKIFVIFKRLHGKGEYSGTGIGLSICKKIVENMGGQIWVKSEVGKGSTFYFTIKKP